MQEIRPLWTMRQAARRLNMSVSACRQRPDIPWVDMRSPGAKRAVWRIDPDVIETIIRERTVNPLKR